MRNGNNRGITLVALIVTIIVLLILVGITIQLTIGERGIFNLARTAGKNYINATQYEQEMLNTLDQYHWENIKHKNEVRTLTIKEMFESYSSYIKESNSIIVQKSGDILFYTLMTGNGNTSGQLIPSGVWTTIGILKEEYRPAQMCYFYGTTGNVKNNVLMQVLSDGSVSVYQASGTNTQCSATFIYPVVNTNNTVEVTTLAVQDMFETGSSYINQTDEIAVQKYHQTLFYTLITSGDLIPSGVWTTIGVLKQEYRPVKTCYFYRSKWGS